MVDQQLFIFETLTGQVVAEFTPVSATGNLRVNEADSVTVTLDLEDDVVASEDWRNLGTPWKHSIAYGVGGRWMGGPIQPHDYRGDERKLELTAAGIRSIFKKRAILPREAMTTSLVRADGYPETALDTNLRGLDLGTIGKRLIQQAMSWPASNYPIQFEADRAGVNERNYAAVDLKWVSDALTQLSEVENGPDFAFDLYRVNDSRFGWRMRSGTAQTPRLISPDIFTWEVSAPDSSGYGVAVSVDPTNMASVSWGTGGRSDDQVLVAMAYSSALVDSGYPLLETVDTSRTSVSQQATLDAYAVEALRTADRPLEFRSFTFSLDRAPLLSEFSVGDLVDLVVAGDPYVADGTYRHRILELGVSLDSDWVSVTCGEAYDG